MKKSIYLCCVVALGAMLVACRNTEPQSGGDSRFLITIPAAADDTRIVYDGDKSLTLWEEGDQLQVITFYNNPATEEYTPAADGYQLFSMEGAFDEEYAEFSGYIVKVPSESGTFPHRLHAFYPAKAMTAAGGTDTGRAGAGSHEVTLPSTQRPTLESFDGDAAFMCSAPLPIEISDNAAGKVEPFKFRHITGFLRLRLGLLPDGMEDETIESVVMIGGAGSAMSGIFGFGIDGDTSGETYTISEVDTRNQITLDYSDKNLRFNELTDCWFATMPGVYDDVTFTVNATSGKKVIYSPRRGLEIKAGVITPATLNFGDGDEVKEADICTITITNADFPFLNNVDKTGYIIVSPQEDTAQTFSIKYNDLRRHSTNAIWYILINSYHDDETAEFAGIYNTDALGVKIISITMDAPLGYTNGKILFGTAAEVGAFEQPIQTHPAGVSATTFTPIDKDADYPFFAIRGRAYNIRSMTIKYIPKPE